MNDRACPVCGCAVSQRDGVCPVCGTELPDASRDDAGARNQVELLNARQRPSAPKEKLRPKRHDSPDALTLFGFSVPKRICIVAGIALGLVLVAAVALIVRAVVLDQQLKARVQEAEEGGSSVSASVTRSASSSKSVSGNVASGGLVARTGDGTVVSNASEILMMRDSALEGAHDKRASAGALDLALDGSTLYFLEPVDDWGMPFEGSSIKTIADVDDEGQKTPQTVQDDGPYRCLTCEGGYLYYLKDSGDGFKAMRASAAEGASEQEIGSFDADEVWLFVDDGEAYIVESSSSGWKASTLSNGLEGADGDSSWIEVARGSGKLRAACVSNGTLYYSPSQDGSHMQKSDLKGGFAEYPDVKEAVSVAVSGEVVAVVTKSGALVWIDASTGVVHDLTGELDRLLPDAAPSRLAISVSGSWIYLADDGGELIRVGTKGASGEVLS